MARVIELRAWNKYHKKMHSVYEINFDHSIAKTRDDETGGTYTFGFIDLELMQFTGLRDKKGVKIFEGDIVQLYYSNWLDKIEIIKYSNGSFGYGGEHIFTAFSCLQSDMECGDHFTAAIKVIGNIHQNPELLEKK